MDWFPQNSKFCLSESVYLESKTEGRYKTAISLSDNAIFDPFKLNALVYVKLNVAQIVECIIEWCSS